MVVVVVVVQQRVSSRVGNNTDQDEMNFGA